MFHKQRWLFLLIIASITIIPLNTLNPAEAQAFRPRISIVGAPTIDICTSTHFDFPIDLDFDAQPRGYSDILWIPGSGLASNDYNLFDVGPYTGAGSYGFDPTPYSAAPHTIIQITLFTYYDTAWTDVSWVAEMHVDCTTNEIVYLYNGPPATAQNIPHLSDIRIDASSPTLAYVEPQGDLAKLLDGTVIELPHDFDNNGFDTYIVTDKRTVDDQVWVQIFLGNMDFVWVRLPSSP